MLYKTNRKNKIIHNFKDHFTTGKRNSNDEQFTCNDDEDTTKYFNHKMHTQTKQHM
jgi:hypothetical protein